MIFRNRMTALNPVFTVGPPLDPKGLRLHKNNVKSRKPRRVRSNC